MGKIVFVEFLDKRGNISKRARVDSFPATVGRSYRNAAIVDDPLVNPEHLKLSLDSEGGVIVEDLQTRNGTRLLSSRERIEQHVIPSGGEAVFRIGQTVLRLRGDEFAVGPATSSQVLSGALGRVLEKRAIAFLLFAGGFGLSMAVAAQELYKKSLWSDLTGICIIGLILSAVYAGFWSFINRLVAHSFRFATHLGILGIATAGLVTIFTAVEYFEFIFTAQSLAEAVRLGGVGLAFALLLYGHLSVMSESSRRKHAVSSALVSVAIVAVILLAYYAKKKEFSTELHFSSIIKPVARQWVRTVSSDQFFNDLGKLKAKIGAMAQEGQKEKPSND